jgi:hypothetical protein
MNKTRCGWRTSVFSDYTANLIKLYWHTALDCRFLMALKLTTMRNSTVIDKPLGTPEIFTLTVEADEFHKLAISPLEDRRSRIFL